MKKTVYVKCLQNIRWLAFPYTATRFAPLLVLLVMSACTTTRNDQPKDALYTQIYGDMMYGADDYFGQSMDLAYADGVVPTVVQPVFTTSESTAMAAPVAAPVAVAPPPVVVITPPDH